VAVAAVAAFSFLSGGYILGRSTPVVVACLGLAAVWVWFLRRRSRPSWLFLTALAVFAAFTLWTGSSVLWSFGPDLTWAAFNLVAFYLAVVAVLGLTSARGLQLRTAGYGYLVAATAVGIYAFLGKVIPEAVTHAHKYARLDSPVGYWNVLALMMVMGFCVALSLAGDRRAHPAWRTAAVAAGVPMCFTFYFALSRGGWIALAVALLLYFVFTTTRLASFFSLVAVIAPVAFVVWRLRGLSTLTTATTDDALRTLEGGVLLRWSVAAVVVAACLQLVAALVHRAVPWPKWVRPVAGATIVVVLVAGAAWGSWRAVEARGGAAWVTDRVQILIEGSDETDYPEGATRLVSLNTGRPPLWREALQQSAFARLSGTGAGTFRFSHYRFREGGGIVKHAHSQWFNVLSELGVIGLVLFVAAMALLVAAMVGNPFSRRDDPLHPLLVAMQAGVIAFVVHLSWDWDWDMAAIGTLVFVFVAASASYRMTRVADDRRRARRSTEAGDDLSPAAATVRADNDSASVADAGEDTPGPPGPDYGGPGRAEERGSRAGGAPAELADGASDVAATGESGEAASSRRGAFGLAGWAPRVVASTALVLLALSWLPPYLAGRAENAAHAASSKGDVVVALGHARRAARLNPLAVSPLLTESLLLQQLGRNLEALQKAEAATRLQPANHEAWYQLGLLQLKALGRKKAARASFRRALALNPEHAGSRYELEVLAN
jgi:hypothetical protein